MKIVKTLLLAAIFCVALPGYAENFGDQVARCAAKYKLPVDSPDISKVFEICEKEIYENRVEPARVDEDQQNRTYINCLISRRVNPPNIPKIDSEFCLREAGIYDPGDNARKLKGLAWRNCLTVQAKKLDDGTSPVSEISRGIIGLCSKEWNEYVGSLWMYPDAKRGLANGLDRYGIEDGVRAVLLVRKAKKEGKIKPQ